MPDRDLSRMLGTKPSRPDIRRGPGFRLSTEIEDDGSNLEIQKSSHQATQQAEPKIERKKLGWAVRSELIKQFKQLALNEDRDAYELLEEAMEAYLAQRSAS